MWGQLTSSIERRLEEGIKLQRETNDLLRRLVKLLEEQEVHGPNADGTNHSAP